MRLLAALLPALLVALCVSAQEVQTTPGKQRVGAGAQPASAGDRQRASVERQRAGIRARLQPAETDQDSFFTAPWPPLPLPAAAAPACEPVPAEQIGPLVEQISKREGLAPDLLRTVIEKESGYLPCAVSEKGALGLMQLMPETAEQLGVRDPFDPAENLSAGAKFLKQMLTRYQGNLAAALAAYNAGPSRTDAAGGIPAISETTNYVSGIVQKLNVPAAVAPAAATPISPPAAPGAAKN
jgi:soluble lytic murein transglycosylase-like protein